MNPPAPYRIGIPVYEGVDLLDVAVPREVFGWMAESVGSTRDFRIQVLGATRRPVTTRAGLAIVPEATFDEAERLDLLWVPGGSVDALKATMASEPFLQRLRGPRAGGPAPTL